MIDLELARQSAELMRARAVAWRNFLRVVNGGKPGTAHDGCDHDLDLLEHCRRCGELVPEAERA